MTDSYYKNPTNKNQIIAAASIYFKIKTTPRRVSEDDIKTTQLQLKLADSINEYQSIVNEDKTEHIKSIIKAEEAVCDHFEKMISTMQEDIEIIQDEISFMTNKFK